jgi:two-component system, chemotaxis family, protein-glutamate methylesterase/glutaminase
MAKPRRGPSAEANAPRDMLVRRDGAQDVRLTDLGCPDCRGVLSVKVESETGLLVFTCLIGHRFSSDSLLPIKEDQVESALWSAVEGCEELVLLHRELGARAEQRGARELATRHHRRADRAQANADTLRALVADDEPVSTEPDREERAGA